MKYIDSNISELIGKHVVSVAVSSDKFKINNEILAGQYHDFCDFIYFACSDGTEYVMGHVQSCCEDVFIEDIVGDVNDMVGLIVDAREEHNFDLPPLADFIGAECTEWTFYIIQSNRGTITIRWFGSSSGYYSTDAPVYKVVNDA